MNNKFIPLAVDFYTILYIGSIYIYIYIGRGAANGSSGCSVPAIPSWLSTTCLRYRSRCIILRTTSCLSTVVVGKQGHASCKITSL